jgi:hypothetical protein
MRQISPEAQETDFQLPRTVIDWMARRPRAVPSMRPSSGACGERKLELAYLGQVRPASACCA